MLPAGISLERSSQRATLTATADLAGIATQRFARSAVAIDLELGLSDDVEMLGYAFTQFAMPVWARAEKPFDFAPAHNLKSPACVLPLLIRDGGAWTLLAPLANHHEQIITVEGTTVRWGWHGDLDEIPAGFATTLGIYTGPTATALFEAWGAELRGVTPVGRPPRFDNAITSKLSYWTDNGAAYWYRTEPGQTIAESVSDVVDRLRNQEIPIGALELDSWFYRHEQPRAITAFGYPDVVPPSGMMEWLPRADAYAEVLGDPIIDLQQRTEMPFTLHARHISPLSPYVDETWWVDEHAAHPSDPAFFERWFTDAKQWGASCIEQDWMLMVWFGVREMRRVPGRAVDWQRAMNSHARTSGVDLIWCMATPADLIAAAELDRVIAVRTSDDYRFADDPAVLWTWFLTVNRLVAPLGLQPFKDCFFSNPEPDPDDSISGDVHAELEALLSALSGGPIGIGDRIGRTDREIVMRTCNDDGTIRHVDRPIGLIDDCLLGAPARGDRLAWATASTTVNDQTWTYVVAINTAAVEGGTLDDELSLAEIGARGERTVYDWRAQTATKLGTLTAQLGPRDWAYFIVCPHSTDDIGDTSKYVTVPADSSRAVRG